jgi:hypothetical protein
MECLPDRWARISTLRQIRDWTSRPFHRPVGNDRVTTPSAGLDLDDKTARGMSNVKATMVRPAALCLLCRERKTERVKHVVVTDRNQDKARATLQRIADALGSSPAMLSGSAHVPGFPDETSELLHLWARIEDPAGRRRALAVMHSLAAAEQT